MHDVFLSYSREDHDSAKRIAEILKARGFSVWWDREIQIRAGQTFNVIIDRKLEEAHCVLVLWSKSSTKSRYVLDEADEGVSRGVFVHVTLDGTRPPLGFRRYMFASLEDWDGNPRSKEINEIIRAVEYFVAPRENYEN